MAFGITEIDFGAYPGATDVTLDITGQAGLVATSNVEAYLQPRTTVDHSVDEHLVEEIDVKGRYVVDGTLRIHARWNGTGERPNGGDMLYGKWSVGWVWTN